VEDKQVQIIGKLKTPSPFQDKWSQKKKKGGHRRPSSSNQSSIIDEIAQSGMSPTEAKATAQCLTDMIEDLSKELNDANRILAKEELQLKNLKSEFWALKSLALGDSSSAMAAGSDGPGTIVTEGSNQALESSLQATVDAAYSSMDSQRDEVHQLKRIALQYQMRIKDLGHYKYAYLKHSEKAESVSTSSTSRSKGKQKAAASTNAPVPGPSSASAAPSSITSRPTLNRPGSMDYTEATAIDGLREEIKKNNGNIDNRKVILVPGGTDPGVKTLFETVVVPESTLIKLQNRFAILSDLDSQQGNKDMSTTTRRELLEEIRIPETHSTTVAHIRHLSFLNKEAQSRARALSDEKNRNVTAAYQELAKKSPQNANTIEELEEAAQVRREAREHLVQFEHSSRAKNSRHTKKLRLDRTYDHVASKERQVFKHQAGKLMSIPSKILCDFDRFILFFSNMPILMHPLVKESLSSTSLSSSSSTSSSAPAISNNGYCTGCKTHHRPELVPDNSHPSNRRLVLKHVQGCPKSRPVVIPLFLHGAAGTGAGSRLKGNNRMGGNSIPHRHMRFGPVCKTNEHNSSKTCPFCFELVRLVRAKRQKKGKTRIVRVNGAVECTNNRCVSYRAGYCIRGRDANAALNIAIAGYSQLVSQRRDTLPPFSPKRPRSQFLTTSSLTGDNTSDCISSMPVENWV
jgi:hypothetical protein